MKISYLSARNCAEYSMPVCEKPRMINGLERFRTWTENPRVGGSILSLATIKSVMSNSIVRCVSDQYQAVHGSAAIAPR
jgi:hypothetical protein